MILLLSHVGLSGHASFCMFCSYHRFFACPPQMQGLEGKAEGHTWLLPLMRLHVRGARLAFWGKELLPIARALANRAMAASK